MRRSLARAEHPAPDRAAQRLRGARDAPRCDTSLSTTEVENYPGFRNGITGPELMDEMREQALRFGANLRMAEVESLSLADPPASFAAFNTKFTCPSSSSSSSSS